MKEPVSWIARYAWLVLGLWIAALVAGRALLEMLPADLHALRVCAALLPVVPTLLLLFAAVQVVRSMDEMHQRVHLEALVIAFPLGVLLLVTLGYLQLATPLSIENWSFRHVAAMLPGMYFLGLAVSWGRYR